MLGAGDGFLVFATVLMKVVHISALCLWVAGLIILMVVFRRYRPGLPDRAFIEFRKLSHYGYIGLVTPAAVISVAAGIVLIILRWIFDPWLLIKLLLVCGLVALHAYVGHMISLTAKSAGEARVISPWWVMGGTIIVSAAIFWIVLDKPPVSLDELPTWMSEPQSLPTPSLPFQTQGQLAAGLVVPI